MDKVSLVNLLVGGLLPLIVATVSKETWAGWVKGITLAALSAVGGIGTDFLNNTGGFTWHVALWSAAVTFGSGVAAHFGIYKDTPLQAALQSAFYDVENKVLHRQAAPVPAPAVAADPVAVDVAPAASTTDQAANLADGSTF